VIFKPVKLHFYCNILGLQCLGYYILCNNFSTSHSQLKLINYVTLFQKKKKKKNVTSSRKYSIFLEQPYCYLVRTNVAVERDHLYPQSLSFEHYLGPLSIHLLLNHSQPRPLTQSDLQQLII
jgi:hypothetical protein